MDTTGETGKTRPGVRYYPVILNGEIIGYLYASETDDWASFVRRMESSHDTLRAAVEWSNRLDQAGNYGFSPLQALRHWVGKPEHPLAGGIAAGAQEQRAFDETALDRLANPPQETAGPIRYFPITRRGEVLGYLWATESGDAANYIHRVGAGAASIEASQTWMSRLDDAEAVGTPLLEALHSWIGEPEDPVAGAIALDAVERAAPSVDFIQRLASEES